MAVTPGFTLSNKAERVISFPDDSIDGAEVSVGKKAVDAVEERADIAPVAGMDAAGVEANTKPEHARASALKEKMRVAFFMFLSWIRVG
jgi:hypothetical protein